MNVELANLTDEQILNEVLNDEKYEWIKSYDIHIKMFYKYGKYDKDGELRTPALVKNGKPIPMVIKIVSSFNRLTDNVDVKIVINKEMWDEYTKDQKVAALDGILHYLELKTDKIGEPIPISDENDKVQLKLRKPDFFCEGFNCLAEKYKNNYIPIQEAINIANLVNLTETEKQEEVKAEEKPTKKKSKKKEESEVIDEEVEDEIKEDQLDEILGQF